jgi:hypothetical protein
MGLMVVVWLWQRRREQHRCFKTIISVDRGRKKALMRWSSNRMR